MNVGAIIIKTHTIHFSIGEPSAHMIRSLQDSENSIKNGELLPAFSDVNEALHWLHEPTSTYDSSVHQKISKTTR